MFNGNVELLLKELVFSAVRTDMHLSHVQFPSHSQRVYVL